MSPRRHLIVRIAALGDVAMASSLARRIRAEEGDARIAWLTGKGPSPLVKLFPEVDEVLELDEIALLRGGPGDRARVLLAVWRQLRALRFDRVYLLHPDARWRLLVAGAFGAQIVRTGRRPGQTNPIPGRYAGDEFARIYSGTAHTGPIEGHWPLSDPHDRLPPVPAELAAAGAFVVLVPGGARNVLRADALKRWPVQSYAALASKLAAQGERVVLVGDSGDAWASEHFGDTDVIDLIGRLPVDQTLSVMRASTVVVSHDTGPMHLARLVRAPLVALFGPTSPDWLLLPDERTVVLWGGAHLACRPCYDGRDFARCEDNICIRSISVSQVLEATSELLRAGTERLRTEAGTRTS
jgi:heptosyltransferase II